MQACKGRFWVIGIAFAMCALLFAGLAATPAHAATTAGKSADTVVGNAASADKQEMGFWKDFPNLNAAKKKYKVKGVDILTATSLDKITAALSEAGQKAKPKTPVIVHVPKGSYKLSRYLVVPKNVIMVAEDGVTFTGTAEMNSMILLKGVLYGGTYSGGNKVRNVVYFDHVKFKGNNGIAENLKVTKATCQGILTIEESCRNAQVINCETYGNKQNGISAERGSYIKLIKNCNTHDNGLSGINLSHSDVGTIQKCQIINNNDKAISTNSDPLSTYTGSHRGCNIDTIKSCTINGNKVHGVYLKPYCYVKHFVGNTLTGNFDGIRAAGYGSDSSNTGPSSFKDVRNNVFKNMSHSTISVYGKGTYIYLGDNNKIYNCEDSGVLAQAGGKIVVGGKDFTVSDSTRAGFSISDGAVVEVTGGGLLVSGNGTNGFYLRGSGTTLSVKSAGGIVRWNKATAVYAADGAKATIEGVSFIDNANVEYATNGGSITIR